MSQQRIFVNGAVYFVSTRTFNSLSVFKTTENCLILLDNLSYYRKSLKFKLFGYCLLPDHLHLLIRPGPKYVISKIMQAIKYRTASDIHKRLKISAGSGEPGSPLRKTENVNMPQAVWQKSFYDRIIRNYVQLINTINYIDYNAVKHGLVDDPIKYPYSSFHNHHQTGKELIKIDQY